MASLRDYSVIDLFCGTGGLTHGFVNEGFNVTTGIDCDKSCKFAYEANNSGARFIKKDVTQLAANDILDLCSSPSRLILVGCAPCQPFSQYAKKHGVRNEKWKLLDTFLDLVIAVQPAIVSMENVPELVTFDHGRVFKKYSDGLRQAGYHVTHFKAFAPNYGVPQNRTRLVLFASRTSQVQLIPGTHEPKDYFTVRKAISHLPAIEAGETCQADLLHKASSLSAINLMRIRQSVPGGTWRDWEKNLIARCHTKVTGDSYDSVYGRMRWDSPAPTITTQCNGYGNGRFGHPEQDRAISMREAAILQSFPEDYRFLAPENEWPIETLARLIGNAVPVALARAIARSIKTHIGY